MVEFNPDGSLKLPDHVAKAKAESELRMQNQRCMRIRREIVSFSAPKKCLLKITLSDAISDNRFIETIYNYFKNAAKTPTKLRTTSPNQFEVEISTDFKRCTDCNKLISEYREFLCGNVIEEKGQCTFEGRRPNFCEEDYFE